MSEIFNQDEQHHEALRKKVEELVHSSWIQLAALRDASERIHSVGERLSSVTESLSHTAQDSGEKKQR